MLTREEILTEYTKCLESPIYAIETYLVTFDKTQEGFVPFKLFPRQKEIIYAYEEYRYNLVTKPRQAGVSTTTAAYQAIKVGFADADNPEAVLILANKQDLAFEFLAKIKDFLQQLPRWIWGSEYYGSEVKEKKSIFSTDSKKEIILPNGSRVKAVATSKDALRGFAPTHLIMDEAAYIDNGAEVFGTALTALGTGGKCTLISTPNGHDALYYKTYELAKAKDNDFNIIEMRWYEDSRYNKGLTWIKGDEVVREVQFTFESYEKMVKAEYKPESDWYNEMCRSMNNDSRMIARELDVSFVGSGGNVVDDKYIENQKLRHSQEPKWVKGLEKEIWIWKEPIEGHQYILGSDVSRGDSEDSSTIVILDFTTMEQVMEYKGKHKPDELAQIIEEYGNMYKAYTVVDITGGMGVPTVLKLLEFGYEHLHYDTINGKILSSKQRKLQEINKDDNKIPGFQVGNIRLPMIANFEEKIRLDMVKIRSVRLIGEMRTFIFKNGRADHQDGFHDDLIMAMAMCLWVIEHQFKNLKRLEEQTKTILNSWLGRANEANVEPDISRGTGFVSANNRYKTAAQKPNFSPIVSKNMQDPNGTYSWLFSGMK